MSALAVDDPESSDAVNWVLGPHASACALRESACSQRCSEAGFRLAKSKVLRVSSGEPNYAILFLHIFRNELPL